MLYDRLFVLGDERYSENQYLQLLPDYIRENLQIVEGSSFDGEIKKN